MSTLSLACHKNGWWLDYKRSPVWRISAGKAPQRKTIAAVQGYLQAGSEGLRNGPQQMGNLDIWAFNLEVRGASWPLPISRDTCSASQGKEAVPKPAKSGSWTGDRLYLSSVWKGLSLLNWPSQPHLTLFQDLYLEHITIVSWDWRMPTQCNSCCLYKDSPKNK